jgi:hypothetical protein
VSIKELSSSFNSRVGATVCSIVGALVWASSPELLEPPDSPSSKLNPEGGGLLADINLIMIKILI